MEIVGSHPGIETTLRPPQTPRRGEELLRTASLALEPAAECPLFPSSFPSWGERRHSRGRLLCVCAAHLPAGRQWDRNPPSQSRAAGASTHAWVAPSAAG